MKKRFVNLISAIVAIFCGLFAFSACSKVEFEVNFVVDGAVYATLNTSGEEVVKMPENPTKDDYDFDGWYWDKDTWQTPFTANSLLDAPLSSDMNVYCKWKPKTMHVGGISLNKSEVSLHVDETEILTATITPANATDTSVSWESSNTTIVTVTGGKITALRVGSATITATANDGGKTASCVVQVPKDTIIFKTLQMAADGETVYGKVSNATTTFSFLKEIEEQGNATYQVYKEITCETLFASKSISLNVGDNTVYILQTAGKNLKLYTVTVRRRPMYTVSFDADGGTAVQSQQVEEDSFATKPTTRRAGYAFTRWTYDFTKAITKDTEIKAVWSVNTDTKYKTEYYLQNLENDKYTLHETSNLQGTTDTTANAEIKKFAHFTFNANISKIQDNINGSGSLVLKVYYTRDKYNVTFDGNGGTLESGEISQILKYEGAAVAPVFTRTGYTFIGWDKTIPESVYEDITVTAQWKANRYTLTLIYGNGQPTESIAKDCDAKLEIPDPERAGYDFIGWDISIPKTMPAENITRTAKWSDAIFKLSGSGETITGLSDYGKKKYTKIVIPAEIEGVKITSIGKEAFYGCSGLRSVTIGNGVTSIGEQAFYGCSGLTSITIPDSVTFIEKEAFKGCIGLTYNIKDNLKYLGDAENPYLYLAETISKSINEAKIDDNCRLIGSSVFSGCYRLTSITIPFVGTRGTDSTGKIVQYPFGYIFGQSSYTGGVSTFQTCFYISNNKTYLESYYIPSSLKNVTVTRMNINDYAFYDCSGLTSITIGNNVISIGKRAFYELQRTYKYDNTR